MAAPTYQAGTLGNGINAVSLASGKSIACVWDCTTVLASAATCKILAGATAITTATTFSIYRCPGQSASAPQTTLSAGPSSGATSISVTSATGISKNCIIGIIPAAGGVGEIATVSTVSGTTVTVAALTNGYSTGDYVFLIDQTATVTASPGTSWVANTEYSQSIYSPANMLYLIGVKNADASYSVVVTVTIDKNPAFQ
jgi:hypothetical protein